MYDVYGEYSAMCVDGVCCWLLTGLFCVEYCIVLENIVSLMVASGDVVML